MVYNRQLFGLFKSETSLKALMSVCRLVDRSVVISSLTSDAPIEALFLSLVTSPLFWKQGVREFFSTPSCALRSNAKVLLSTQFLRDGEKERQTNKSKYPRRKQLLKVTFQIYFKDYFGARNVGWNALLVDRQLSRYFQIESICIIDLSPHPLIFIYQLQQLFQRFHSFLVKH